MPRQHMSLTHLGVRTEGHGGEEGHSGPLRDRVCGDEHGGDLGRARESGLSAGAGGAAGARDRENGVHEL